MAVRDGVDDALVSLRNRIAAGERAAADIAVYDAVLAVDGHAVDRVDRAAVVKDGAVAGAEHVAVGDRLDHAGVVVIDVDTAGAAVRGGKVHIGKRADSAEVKDTVVVGVDVLGLGKLEKIVARLARHRQDRAGFVDDDGRAARAGGSRDDVGRDPAAADGVLHGHSAAVYDRCQPVRGGVRGSQPGDEVQRAAVQLQRKGAAVGDPADGMMPVQVEGDIVRGVGGVSGGLALFLKGAAVCKQGDRGGDVLREDVKGARQRVIILVVPAVVRHGAPIEAVDVGRTLRRLADGDRAAIGIAAGEGDAGEIPEEVVVILRALAHRRVRGRGVRRADRHHAALIDDIVGLAVNGRGVFDRVAGIHLIMGVFLLVQDEGGHVFRGNAGQGDDGVLGDVGNHDVRAADGSRSVTARDGGAEIGQPACVIGEGVVELAVVAAGNETAVEHNVHLVAIPVFAVLVVFPRACAGADGVLVAAVAVLQPGVVDGDVYVGNIGAGLRRLMGGRGAGGACGHEVDHAGAFGACDMSAVLRGIELVADVDRAVDVQLRVLEVVRRADCSGAVGGRVADVNHLQAVGSVGTPVLCVIEIDGSIGGEVGALVDR